MKWYQRKDMTSWYFWCSVEGDAASTIFLKSVPPHAIKEANLWTYRQVRNPLMLKPTEQTWFLQVDKSAFQSHFWKKYSLWSNRWVMLPPPLGYMIWLRTTEVQDLRTSAQTDGWSGTWWQAQALHPGPGNTEVQYQLHKIPALNENGQTGSYSIRCNVQ